MAILLSGKTGWLSYCKCILDQIKANSAEIQPQNYENVQKPHFWQNVQGVFASKLRPQTQSSGFSDNWANQRLVSLLSFAFWRNLRAQSSINPSERRFLCCSFLSWSCWRKLGKARKRTLESKLKRLGAKNNLLKGNPVASNQIKSNQNKSFI